MAEWQSLPDLLKQDMADSITEEGRLMARLRRYERGSKAKARPRRDPAYRRVRPGDIVLSVSDLYPR